MEAKFRRLWVIAEIIDLDPYTKIIKTSSVFKWDSVKDEHIAIGSSKALDDIKKTRGWNNTNLENELKRR